MPPANIDRSHRQTIDVSPRGLLVHRLFGQLRRVLPSRLSAALRAFATAILTPIYFAHSTGHFRSALRSKAVDKHGDPIPWYSYPAVYFLLAKSAAFSASGPLNNASTRRT